MFGGINSLNDLKKNKYVLSRLIWDIEPKQLMEPSCRITEEGKVVTKSIEGFLFYIDSMTVKPALFLMCHTSGGYAETIAKIEGIPDELITEAIAENKNKMYFGMYPINKKIERWLKKEFSLED